MEWLRALDVHDVAQKLWAPRRTKVAVIVVLAGGLFVFKWVSVRAEVRTRIFHRRTCLCRRHACVCFSLLR